MLFFRSGQANRKSLSSLALLIVGVVLMGVLACGAAAKQDDGVSKAALRSTNVLVRSMTDNTNAKIGESLITKFKIQSEDAQLDLSVSDRWKDTSDTVQDSMVDDFMGSWMTIAGENGWTGLARINIIDVEGEQVAFESRIISN